MNHNIKNTKISETKKIEISNANKIDIENVNYKIKKETLKFLYIIIISITCYY